MCNKVLKILLLSLNCEQKSNVLKLLVIIDVKNVIVFFYVVYFTE